ncbi:MAG TPA: AMP-binding protein [Gryllotalpicola sp.]
MDHSRTEEEGRAASVAELIARWAAARPEAIFLEDARSERKVDYAELARSAASATAAFAAAGIGPDGAVLLEVADPLDFTLVYLAALASGARVVPIAPGSSAETIAVLGARFDGTVLHVSDRTAAGLLTGEGLVPTGHGSAVLFTSGSTGTPKGVELDEDRLLHVAGAVAAHNALTPADRGFNPLPLFHINAEVVAVLATLVAGATLVLDRRFRRTGFWELLAERRITWVNAVPAILAILAAAGEVTPPASVRFVRSASAPLPGPVRTAFAGVPLVVSYGMTEAASQITATPLDGSAPAGSVGRPVSAELEVRDGAGERMPAGELGEVWVRGAGIVRGYFEGTAAERFDAQGWLRTGDLGSVDADGFVTLAGRSDDVINRGGELVYPSDVEEVLLGDPHVREAVVVARPDEMLGQVPVAFVVTAEPVDHTEAALLADALARRCTRVLPRALRPVSITVDAELPRAATGKVQRARLRAALAGKAE